MGFCAYANFAKARFQDYNSMPARAITLDLDGDLATLSVGAVARQTIWQLRGGVTVLGTVLSQTNYIKTGNWIIKWSGTDLPITVSMPTKVSGPKKLGTRRWIVNFAQVDPTIDVQSFTIFWTNNTATNVVPITDLIVCHEDHEAWVDAGHIANPDYVKFASGISAFRPMTSSYVNESLFTTAADCGREAINGWHPFSHPSPTRGGLPYTAAAKMAMEIGCDLWANSPSRVSDLAEMEIIAASIWNTPGWQASGLSIISEYCNENWNFSSHVAFLRDVYGPANGLQRYEAEAQLCLKWARAFLNVGVPRDRLKITIALQGGGSWSAFGYSALVLNSVDTGNLIGTGGNKKLYQLVDRIVTAAYIAMATSSKGPDTREFLLHARLKNRDLKNRSDAEMDALFDNGIAVTVKWLNNMHTYLNAIGYTGFRGMYEGGQQCVQAPPGLAGTGYQCTIDKTDNTAVWVNTWTGEIPNFDDGDAWWFVGATPNGNALGPATTVATRSQKVYVRRVSDAKARFYLTRAAAIATYNNDREAQNASILLNNTTGAPYWLDNLTRGVEVAERIFQYLDGPAGGAMYRRLVEAQLGTGMHQFAFFQDLNEYGRPPGYAASWGLKRSLYAPDTPRSNYARTV